VKISQTFSIRRLGIRDAQDLSLLAKSTFINAFGPKIIVDEVRIKFDAYVENGYAIETMQSLLQKTDCWCYGMFENEKLIGFIQCSAPSNQSLNRGIDCMEVDRLYVDSKRTGEGLGAMLLKRGIDLAKELNKSKVWLRVWSNNEAAVRFYLRHGFVDVDRADDKWMNPGDFDYVLEMDIKKVA